MGEFGRLIRFATVGVVNTLLTLVVFVLLTRSGLGSAPASAVAFGAGAASGYLLNGSWTFRGSARGPSTLLRYVAVQILGAALSAGGVWMASSGLSVQHLAAEVLVLPIVTLTTYTLSRRLVFGVPAAAAHS
jgi:putative flippase GtrA